MRLPWLDAQPLDVVEHRGRGGCSVAAAGGLLSPIAVVLRWPGLRRDDGRLDRSGDHSASRRQRPAFHADSRSAQPRGARRAYKHQRADVGLSSLRVADSGVRLHGQPASRRPRGGAPRLHGQVAGGLLVGLSKDRTAERADRARAAVSVACRRKVFEARDNAPRQASVLLAIIRELFDIEDRGKGLSADERRAHCAGARRGPCSIASARIWTARR